MRAFISPAASLVKVMARMRLKYAGSSVPSARVRYSFVNWYVFPEPAEEE